nr:DUF3575 domain-containing protein [uncultured Flavobacterium sp.]
MKLTYKILLFILFSSNVYSQEKKTEEIKEEETYVKVKVYSPTKDSNYTKKYSSWAIKTDIYQYVMGDFAIYGEYKIANRLSAEVGVGVTYPFTWTSMNLIVGDEPSDFDVVQNDNEMLFDDFKDRKIGISLRGTLKYYLSNSFDPIEGFYIGLQYMTRDYKNGIENQTVLNGKTSYNLVLGFQEIIYEGFVLDYNVGVGYAIIDKEFLFGDYNNSNNYRIAGGTVAVPNLTISCKIGFGN